MSTTKTLAPPVISAINGINPRDSAFNNMKGNDNALLSLLKTTGGKSKKIGGSLTPSPYLTPSQHITPSSIVVPINHPLFIDPASGTNQSITNQQANLTALYNQNSENAKYDSLSLVKAHSVVKGGHSVVKGGHPVVKGGHPVVKGGHPVVKGGKRKGSRPFTKGSRPFTKGSRPFTKGSRPFTKGSRPFTNRLSKDLNNRKKTIKRKKSCGCNDIFSIFKF